jgi:alcohol dehydrogenase class IV
MVSLVLTHGMFCATESGLAANKERPVTLAFQTASRIIYGHGSVAELGTEVKRLGARRAFVVTDRSLVENNVHLPVEKSLAAADIPHTVYSDVELDPSPSSIVRCGGVLRQCGADIIIGLGGGSALDSAKALALLSAHGEPLERFFGLELVSSPCLPTILIPTSAGTGSEMTSIVVLLDPATQSKKGIVSTHLFARTVFLDPELTLSLPPFYTAITGLDAFIHAMESYVNTGATHITEAMCLHAMRLIVSNVREAYANGGNREARAAMLYGASLSGMGFANTQTGIIHAIGHAVPAAHHLPHGLLMAAVSPMGIAFNSIASPQKYARIAEILGCCQEGKNVYAQAARAVDGMKNLLRDLGIAHGLAAHGVSPDEIPGIARRAAADARLMAKNPRQGTAENLETLIREYF